MFSYRSSLEMDALGRDVRFYVDCTPFKISLYVADVELGVNKWYVQNICSPAQT